MSAAPLHSASPQSFPHSARTGPGRRAAGLLAALLALALLSACTQSTVFYGAQADTLHGKRALLLRPVLIAPTEPALQQRVLARSDAALEGLSGLGAVLPRDAPRKQPGVALAAVDAYDQFSSSLSLSGISNPEFSRVLEKELHADLLILVQPTMIPCPVCEQGDELWLVGQVVEAHSGRIVFRAYLHGNVNADDTAAQQAMADSMVDQFIVYLKQALRLRVHRERFKNLKALAAH